MNKYRNEEGAVLLLLIIMMSAVVLVLASLLRFNTQNIRFAAIEVEQEQALYLAEGVADSLDYFLMDYFYSDDEISDSEVSTAVGEYVTTTHSNYLAGVANIVFPSSETIAGESSLVNDFITIDNPSNSGSYFPDATTHELVLDITITGAASSRKITVTYKFPTSMPEDGYTSFIYLKELNYSN